MPQLPSPHGMHGYSPNRGTPVGLPPPSPLLGAAPSPASAAAASSTPAPFAPAASECLVIVAHSGREFECPLSPSLTLESLRSSLASPTGVSERDEVLLLGADGAHLSHIQQMAAPGTTLFVYHKLYASADAPKSASSSSSSAASERPPLLLAPPSFPVLDVHLPTAADVSSALRPRSALLSHSKVKVRNLAEYERSMLEHRLTGEAYRQALADAAQQGRKFLGQFQNILSSIDVALVALGDHGSRLSATVEAARAKIDPMLREQRTVLDNFATDVDKLKDTEIKPPMRKYALAAMSVEEQAIHNNAAAAGTAAAAGASTSATAAVSSSAPRLTLHSWLGPSLASLTTLKVRAAKDHEALSAKYAAFLELWTAVQQKVQGALHAADGSAAGATSPSSAVAVAAHPGIVAPIRPSLHRSAAVDAALARIQSLVQFAVTTADNSQDLAQLVRDQEAITEYCNKLEAALTAAGAGGSMSSSSLLSPDVVSEAAAMADRFDALGSDHEEQIIPRFKSAHDQMRAQLLPALAEASALVQSVFLAQMNVIHAASTDLRSLSRSFPPLQEGILRLHSPSFRPTLLSISQLPTAYIHLLHELHRRRGFRRGFEAELQAMSTRVHRLVDVEERPRRARFHELYGMFLPAGATATTTAPATPSSAGGGAGTPTPKAARTLRWVGGFGALLKALQESPPKMDFSFDNFDSALPELDAAALPKLPAASASGSSSAAPASMSMHRSPSGRELHKATLPVIDESSAEASSSSLSPSHAHAGTTPGPAALAAEFPWVEQLTVTQAALATATAREAELLAKIADMERQAAAAAIAASLATGGAPATNSPKLPSRKGSLSSDPSSLSSPSSSAAGPSSRATQKADSAKNAEGLEKLLSAKQDELQRVKDHLAATVALLTSERSKHESDLAAERAKLDAARVEQTAEMMRMGAGAARQIKDIAELKAQISDLQSWKQKQLHDADAIADVRNDLIAVQNFALGDTVLFVRLPPTAPAASAAANPPAGGAANSASAAGYPAAAAASMSAVSVGSASASVVGLSPPQFGPFEAFNIARPFFFLSPDCEDGWRNLIDERMAMEAQSEESPSPAVVAARAIAAQKAAADAAAANSAAAAAAKENRPGVMTRLAAAVGVGAAAAPAPSSPAASVAPAAAASSSSSALAASSSSSSALLPSSSSSCAPSAGTVVVAEFTARIIYIHEERVTRPAIAAKYGLPMGAIFHLLDVEAMQPIRGDIAVQMPPRVVAQM